MERLEHPPTRACVEAERHLLEVSGGGCHSAFGAWASLDQGPATIDVALADEVQGFRRAAFAAPELAQAVEEAADWLRAGAPPLSTTPDPQEEWLCRPIPASC